MPPRGLQTSKWELSAKEKVSIPAPRQKWEWSTYSSRLAAHVLPNTETQHLVPAPPASYPFSPLSQAPASSFQGIWSCHFQASGKVAQAFSWRQQDLKSSQVPNRTDNSTCLKLNSWIKSRASKLSAWNHPTADEGLSSHHPPFFLGVI